MLRAPTWSMSTTPAIRSTCRGSTTSLTTGSPVAARTSASSSSASSPIPWNVCGEVRGLYAPPRSIVAPSRRTARAVSPSIARPSTEHGPAITTTSDSPTVTAFPTRTAGEGDGRDAVGSGWTVACGMDGSWRDTKKAPVYTGAAGELREFDELGRRGYARATEAPGRVAAEIPAKVED